MSNNMNIFRQCKQIFGVLAHLWKYRACLIINKIHESTENSAKFPTMKYLFITLYSFFVRSHQSPNVYTNTARDISILSPEREKSPIREKCLLFGRIQIAGSSHLFSQSGEFFP